MRFLIKISWPVEAGNRAAKEGFKTIPSILEDTAVRLKVE